MGCLGLCLWIAFVGLCISAIILGGFVSHANVFTECTKNGTNVSYPVNGDPDDLCLEEFTAHTVAFTVFLIIFFITLVYTCVQRDPEKDVLSIHPPQPGNAPTGSISTGNKR